MASDDFKLIGSSFEILGEATEKVQFTKLFLVFGTNNCHCHLQDLCQNRVAVVLIDVRWGSLNLIGNLKPV